MPEHRQIQQTVFRGSHRERGRQRGRLIAASLDLSEADRLAAGFVEGCRQAAEALHPPVAEEFAGLLETAALERRALEAYYFARLESRLGGCTMFAVTPPRRPAGAGPIIGRNYDWAVSDLRWCRLHRFVPQAGPRRLAYTHHWAGSPDVLNQWGLYLAIASLPVEPVAAPGVQWSILVEAVTEGCTTVQEAVQVLTGVRHLRPMSYLLGDAGGDAAVVEGRPGSVTVRRPERGLVLAGNHVQGGEVLATWPPSDDRPALSVPKGRREAERRNRVRRRSERRVERARDMLDVEGPIRPAEVRRVLREHQAPICTGDHGQPDGGRWATIWSGICEPAGRAFHITPGLPCRFAYQRFTL